MPERLTRSRRIPKHFGCTRFDHRQAIHLLQHPSSSSHKDGTKVMLWQFLQFTKGQSSSGQPPCLAGPFDTMQDDLVDHQNEAYWRGKRRPSLKPPFNLKSIFSPRVPWDLPERRRMKSTTQAPSLSALLVSLKPYYW